MFNFEPILQANPIGVLSTQDGDKVRARVFQYLFADGKKIYFCTSSEKQVYSQLHAHPQASFCTWAMGFNPVLSVNGAIVFSEDKALKKRALAENPGIEQCYGSEENPLFKLFYIEVEDIETFSTVDGLKIYKI